jgi:predicted amidohydrolase YtcJ
MYHFITRDSITGGVVGANQAVSRDTALRMLTINYAQLTDETAIKGSIEPNKLGDFVVLSGDFMAMPAAELEDLKAVATFVGGKKVYQDPAIAL